MARVPQRYIPKHLSRNDAKTVRKELKKSRRSYKQGKYHMRKKIKSFKGKQSKWIKTVRNLYKIPKEQKITLSTLVKKSGCDMHAMRKIIRKGKGAYYSSGSRPNQTPSSWGRARLYSALSGGPSSAIDLKILENHCGSKSKALGLARKTKNKRYRAKPRSTPL